MMNPTSIVWKAGNAEQFSSFSCIKYAEYDSTVSFNSGHTCSKMEEPKHSKENSASSNLH